MKKCRMILLLYAMIFSLTVIQVVAGTSNNTGEQFEHDVLAYYNFDSEGAGNLAVTEFGLDWSLENPIGDPPELAEENGNRFARMKGYSQVVSPYVMAKGEMYEISAKLHRVDSDVQKLSVFLFGAAAPVSRFNEKVGDYSFINFLEADWYYPFVEKGQNYMGGSGIGIMLQEDVIRVYLRTHIDQALHLGVAYHDFSYPDGLSSDDFIPFTVRDIGSGEIEIYINDTLLTVITFSNVGSYEDDTEDTNEYYKTAKMCDATGAALDLYDSEYNKIEAENNTIANAMISAADSYAGFAVRDGGILDIDDISVSYLKEKIAETATPENTDSTSDPNSTESSVSKAPETAAVQNSDDSGSSNNAAVIVIAVCIAIIAVAIIGYICVRKRKKS